MGVPRLFTLLCAASTVLCNTPGTDRPDITMLYKGDRTVCVAGSNTQGYGLAFMSKYIQDEVYVNDFEYRDENGTAIDTRYNCDFENREGDTCITDWYSHGLVSQFSDTNTLPIAPITDERWNNFKVHRTSSSSYNNYEHDYTKSYKITNNNFFISFSIRSKQDAQILLCSTSTQQPTSTACYWILIDAFESKDTTAIRKCAKGVPNTYPRNDPGCSERRNQTTIKLLSESKWTHFILSRVKGNLIRLWLWDINTGARDLLTYRDDKPLSLFYMYVRSLNTIADWKFHTYQYLITQNPTSIDIPLGPRLDFVSTSICVSFYVILCSKCKMIIKLETEDGIEIARSPIIEGNPDEKFITWRNVKIQNISSVAHVNRNILIYPTLSIIDPNYKNPFWAIDDFRICSNNEIRVSRFNNNNRELICQSLKYPDWTFNPNKLLSSNEPPNCSNGSYIGLHCNISCSVSGYFQCSDNYYKICLATQEENRKGACTCMPGNKWTYKNDCTQNCDYGTKYGYNCNKECGKCKYRRCDRVTGECLDGCDYGYLPPYCQNTFPRLLYPPMVTKELYTSVKVQFNNVTITGSTDTVANIYLECKTENDSWYNCSSPISYDNLKNDIITIINLTKETSYSIRAIVYTTNGDSYRNDDLPIVNATTICKKNWNIEITNNSRNATIHFIYSEDNCRLQNYFVQLYHKNTYVQQYYAKEKTVFLELKPFTDYEIILTNSRYADYTYTKNFKTEQDAPGQIKEIKYMPIGDQFILSWAEPEDRNGIILNYNVTYELIRRIDCTETPQHHKYSFEVAPSGISNVVIQNLQPYSTYYITVFAQTILPGKEVGLNADTQMINDISEEEIPDSISTDATSESVTVRWNTVNCNKQNGPLYFNIVFKCVSDDWCKEINDTVLDNITSKNSEIITSKLTPFTNYEVELRAKREENGKLANFIRTTKLFTPAAKPPAVRNFTAYSKSTNSISLRWLDPYPPHGLLENYYIKYCYNSYAYSCTEVKPVTAAQLSSCDLWNESFKCYVTLPHLFSNQYDTFYIQAKNQDTDYGDDTKIRVRTVEEKPSAPLNLIYYWDNSEINLYWNHPDIPNGRIRKFEIVLDQNGTDLTNQDENRTYFRTYNVSQEMRNYTEKITKLFRHSSSYVVTVYAVNINKGDNATLIIDTPPATPELDGEVTVDSKNITTTTVTLFIPGAKKNTISRTSFLYVTVSKHTKSISKRGIKKQNFKNEILMRAGSNSWIATEREVNEEEITVELGNGDIEYSTNLQSIINNKPLEPDSEYIITVLIINQYKNEKSLSHYTINVKTAANVSELYALLLLLLLPVVGYFVYRYVKKKINNPTYIEPNVPVRHSYLEIVENPKEEENNTKRLSDHEYETVDLLQTLPSGVTEENVYESINDIEKPPTYMNLLEKERALMNS